MEPMRAHAASNCPYAHEKIGVGQAVPWMILPQCLKRPAIRGDGFLAQRVKLELFENKSIDFFFALLAKWACEACVRRRRPLFTSEIVAVKALTTTLCIFQMSTQEVVYQSFKHVSLLKEISTKWKIVEVEAVRARDA